MSIFDCPDHPVIVWCELTGYPRGYEEEPVYCEECGTDITDDDVYEDDHHETLCERCLLTLHKKGW